MSGVFKFKILPLIFSIAIFLFFASNYLLTIPPVWSDEAIIADSAYNLIHENRIGIDLWKGIIPDSEKFGLAYPPLYFYIVAGWLKVFGFSIENLRILSITLGICFLVITFYLLNQVIDKKKIKNIKNKEYSYLLFLILANLILDMNFQKASHMGRPEIMIISLGGLALLFYFLSTKTILKQLKNVYLFLAGFLIGLALFTHYSAGVYLIVFLLLFFFSYKFKVFLNKEFYLFIIPALLPIFLWIISLYPDFNAFLNLFSRQFEVHRILPSWFWLSMMTVSIPERLIYILYLFISWEFISFLVISKSKQYLPILLILILSWIATFIWKIESGFEIIILPIFLSLWILLIEYYKNKAPKFKLILFLTVFMLLLNLVIQLNNLNNFPKGLYSYTTYTNAILDIIPDYTAVYVSAIPDPYFGFKNQRHNTIYLYPMVKPPKGALVKTLDSVDYIIYNQPLDVWVAGNTTPNYISKNAKKIYTIWNAGEYSTSVIELKPKNQRVSN